MTLDWGLIAPSSLVFVAFAMAGGAVLTGHRSPTHGGLRQRISVRRPEDVSAASSRSRRVTSTLHSLTNAADRLDRQGRVRRALEASALSLSPGQAVVGLVALTIVAFGVALVIAGPRLAVVASLVSATAAALYPAARAHRRRAQFRAALPDTLTLVAAALSAGHAVNAAVELVAREATGVTGDEWRRAVVEAHVGLDLGDALARVGDRMRSIELQGLVLVLQVNREVGGDLSGVLRTLATTMRAREQQRRHIRALTAEGRLSAVVLAALPLLFAGYLAVVRPEYLSVLVSTPLGVAMSLIALTLLVGGAWWMRLLIRVDQQ